MGDLFRSEAVDYQRNRVSGEVILGARLPWVVTGYTVAGVVIGLLAVASVMKFDRKQTVPGMLTSQGGIIRVAAPVAGTITKVTVGEGDSINVDGLVAELRLAGFNTIERAGDLASEVVREKTATRSSNLSQIEKIKADLLALGARKTNISAQYDSAVTTRKILVEKSILQERSLRRAEDLRNQGVVSEKTVDDARSAVIDTKQALSNSDTTILSLQLQMIDVVNQLKEIPLLLKRASAETQLQDAGISQKLAQARSASTYVATAPITGSVMAVPVKTGQTVSSGATIAVLSPSNSPLEAELYVPSRVYGSVKLGQNVILRYEAYPFRRFGTGNGKIIAISHSPLIPSEASLHGSKLTEPVYKVRVALREPYLTINKSRKGLESGMILSADIIFGRRSFKDWLLDPSDAAGQI